MSRSKRKPVYTDQQNGCTKKVKRAANRAIRQMNESDSPAKGKAYRKMYSSYDIRDWSSYRPKDKKASRK